MREFVRPVAAALSVACLAACLTIAATGSALAQAKQQMAPSQAAPPPGQPPALKQIALTEKQVEGVIAAETAYIVYVRKDTGQVVISPNVNVPLTVDRAPTHDEIFMTSHVIIKDIVGQQYSAMSAQAGLQLNNYMAQTAAATDGLDLRNLRA